MTTIREPNVTLNILAALVAVANTPQRVLAIGAKTTGSAPSGALQENILNDSSENALFGQNSMLAGMIRNYKKINKVTQIDAIGLDDGAGNQATGNVTFTGGPATEDGLITVTIGSEDHVYEVVVSDTDTITTIGANLEALINADANAPFTATNTAGDVEIEADNGGTEGNFIGIKYSGEVAAITTTLTAMSGGTVNPVLTNLFDVIEGRRYQTVIWPATWDKDTIIDFLDGRFNVSNQVLDGVAVMSETDTYANLIATLTPLNSQSATLFCNAAENAGDDLKGSAVFEINANISAQVSAIRALRLTDGANISRYVTSRVGALDNIGGAAIASLPYFNTPMPYLPLIPTGLGFETSEVEGIKAAGGFNIGNNVAGNATILGEVTTTYKTDSGGNPDITYKYLNTVDTLSNIREYQFNNLKAEYAQSRLTEGSLQPARSMANETKIRGSLIGYYTELSKGDFVLTQAGEGALTFYKDNLTVSIDLSTGTVTFISEVPLVTQLRTIIGSVRASFSIEG